MHWVRLHRVLQENCFWDPKGVWLPWIKLSWFKETAWDSSQWAEQLKSPAIADGGVIAVGCSSSLHRCIRFTLLGFQTEITLALGWLQPWCLNWVFGGNDFRDDQDPLVADGFRVGWLCSPWLSMNLASWQVVQSRSAIISANRKLFLIKITSIGDNRLMVVSTNGWQQLQRPMLGRAGLEMLSASDLMSS